MAKVRIEHNGKGWIELFKSFQPLVDETGSRIASEANANAGTAKESFRYYPKPGNFTAMGFVSSTGPSGAYYEAADKSLTRAVHR